jgi:hypothetical protein
MCGVLGTSTGQKTSFSEEVMVFLSLYLLWTFLDSIGSILLLTCSEEKVGTKEGCL